MYSSKFDVYIACLSVLVLWMWLPQDCESYQFSSNRNGFSQGALSSMSATQLRSLIRDALNYLNKASEEHERAEPKISGLVKLRAIRSGFEDMARLYQLQEIENKFANKARSRFGKRAEVAPDNFLPPYGYQSEEVENNDDDVVLPGKVPDAGQFVTDNEESRRR